MRESGYNALSRQEAADLLYALDDEDSLALQSHERADRLRLLWRRLHLWMLDDDDARAILEREFAHTRVTAMREIPPNAEPLPFDIREALRQLRRDEMWTGMRTENSRAASERTDFLVEHIAAMYESAVKREKLLLLEIRGRQQ